MRDCLSSVDQINLVIAGKQQAPQWMALEEAERHCRVGMGVWSWATTDEGRDPDVVLACAGNIPTIETVAAAELLRDNLPRLRVRVVNIVDLLVLASYGRHERACTEEEFALHFGTDVPVVMGFHGYPSAIHELLHGRTNPNRFHVHGYQEKGTTTTPYCLLAQNRMTRHDLAADAALRAPVPSYPGESVAEELLRKRDSLVEYARRVGKDAQSIAEWQWKPRSE